MVDGLIRNTARALIVIGAVGCTRGAEKSAAQASGVKVTPVAPSVSQSRHTAITQAVARVDPSVVTVQTEAVTQAPSSIFDFFGGGGDQQRTEAGLGTGFVVRADGVIVTNAHVVAGANTVSVMMRDGTVYPAKILGADQTNDIAVIKIDAKNLPVVTLGNSNSLLVGEWAIAIGNPFGFYLGNSEPSVSAGVISATSRNLIGSGEGTAGGSAAYFDMIQTDAAINPGNSGGPLVDADGEVIGVNSNIFTANGGGSIGIGFAIPINRVARVVDDLLTHGSIRRPWMGVRLRQVQSSNPRDMLTQGAVIATVAPGSPADRAGLQAGDVILREGTRAIRNPYDWEAALLDLEVGKPAALHVRRGSREMDVNVTVSDLPEVSAPKVQVLRDIQLVSVTPAIRADRGLRTTSGALIYNVSQAIADATGLQAGDVIVSVNNSRVTSAEDAAKAINYYGQQGYIRMVVERQGQIYVTDFPVQ
jgi:serine protease Do